MAKKPTDDPTYVDPSDGLEKDCWELKSQICIPEQGNIFLLGENPPSSLRHYHVLAGENTLGFLGSPASPTTFQCKCPVLRSTVDVDEKVGYLERPWAVIAAPEGKFQPNMRVRSSNEMFSMKNLEIRVHFDCFGNTPRLYPTMGGVNMMNARRVHAENCFFGLDNQIGSNYWKNPG